jgi:hypothetical protein
VRRRCLWSRHSDSNDSRAVAVLREQQRLRHQPLRVREALGEVAEFGLPSKKLPPVAA